MGLGIINQYSEIEYVKSEKGLIMTAYHGREDQIQLPDAIEGTPIIEIAPYTFANRTDITEIRLPFEVHEIGKYAFYRCSNLKKLILSDNILDIGGGALTGCRGIREVEIHFRNGECSALKSILDEVRFAVHAKMYMKDGIADILFPEHYEEAVEDTPARQFYTQHHGAGGDYRQCFYNRELDYKKYDKLLYRVIAEDLPETVLKLSLGRLRYPYKLALEAKEKYEEYVKDHLVEAFALLIENDDRDSLKFLLAEHYVSEEALNAGIELSLVQKNTEILSMLMDEKRKHFPKKKKTFDF